MRLSGESANFQLDVTYVITPNQATVISIEREINLRIILGDMINKYNKFYIVFNSTNGWSPVATYQSGTFTGISNQTCWVLGITGLPFINNTLDGRITNTAYFPSAFGLPVAGYLTTNFATDNGLIFNKPMNNTLILNISPYFVRNLTIGSVLSASQAILFSFNFTIYGLEE